MNNEYWEKEADAFDFWFDPTEYILGHKKFAYLKNRVRQEGSIISNENISNMSIYDSTLRNVVFENCTFFHTIIESSDLSNVVFKNCNIYNLKIECNNTLKDVVFENCTLINSDVIDRDMIVKRRDCMIIDFLKNM